MTQNVCSGNLSVYSTLRMADETMNISVMMPIFGSLSILSLFGRVQQIKDWKELI